MNDHTMHPMGLPRGHLCGELGPGLGSGRHPLGGTDYGLTLDEAFCDGNYVYLTLQLTGPEEAEQYDHYVMYLPNEEGTRLTVNGQETELFTTGGQTLPDGDYAFALVYELAAPAQDGEELSAALTVPGLYGVYSVDESKSKDWRYDQVGGEFTADFTVTADTSQNQSQELSAEDNGVKLYGIETTPGYLLVDMETPLLGPHGRPHCQRRRDSGLRGTLHPGRARSWATTPC